MNKVLLVNANNNVALAIARGLGREGVPVTGIGWDNGGVGLYSRYLEDKIRIDHYTSLTADRLNEILARTKCRYVIAMGEDVLSHLNSLRGRVGGAVKFLFPENKVLHRAFDKAATLRFAAQVGIDYPKTFFLTSKERVDHIINTASYPLILKFPSSVGPLRPPDLDFGWRMILERRDLESILRRCTEYGMFPLVQEYIPGKGVGVELCMHEGEMVAAFQHERIHELPLSGGPSVYRKSVPLSSELLAQSVALLQAMGWEGVAMVEYRRDSVSGRTVLMEVNGRFWGSLWLAIKSGVNFPYILYQTVGEGRPFKQEPYRINVRVKQSGGHIRWFWNAFVTRRDLPPEGFMSRAAVLKEFLLSWNPRVGFDIENWDDPLPAIRYWLSKIAQSSH